MSEYKLVPVEPTREMKKAAADAFSVSDMLAGLASIKADRMYAAMLAAAPSPEWVKTSDRLPTSGDADERGLVWAVNGGGKVQAVIYRQIRHPHYRQYITHWMPKPRVQPPEPPEGE